MVHLLKTNSSITWPISITVTIIRLQAVSYKFVSDTIFKCLLGCVSTFFHSQTHFKNVQFSDCRHKTKANVKKGTCTYSQTLFLVDWASETHPQLPWQIWALTFERLIFHLEGLWLPLFTLCLNPDLQLTFSPGRSSFSQLNNPHWFGAGPERVLSPVRCKERVGLEQRGSLVGLCVTFAGQWVFHTVESQICMCLCGQKLHCERLLCILVCMCQLKETMSNWQGVKGWGASTVTPTLTQSSGDRWWSRFIPQPVFDRQ